MPHYPHRMRLRGPWECIPLAAAGGQGLPAARRVTMPCTWAGAGLAGLDGRVRFTRRFGYPGRIDPHERVWLLGERLEGEADITLNGQALARGHRGEFAFEVTSLLHSRNQLDVVITNDRDDGGLTGDVGLEIRCTAYLDRMAALRAADGSVVITGAVTGSADGPLEVYVLADGKHAHYETTEASPEGTPLHIVLRSLDDSSEQVRVELINVATVWYVWETALPR